MVLTVGTHERNRAYPHLKYCIEAFKINNGIIRYNFMWLTEGKPMRIYVEIIK